MTSTQSCNLVVHGAAGRMGQRIVACALAEPKQWNLVAAIDRSGHPRLGDDAGQVAGAGDIQVKNAEIGGIFNMGGAAVANYVSVLQAMK